MNKYKIVIRGGYGLYNFGDDALIVALYQYLMNNGISKEDVALMCVPSKYLNQQLDNPLLIDYNSIKPDISIDHLIYGGGTQFYSFDSNNLEKFKKNLFQNPWLIFSKIRNQIILYRRRKYVESKFSIANFAKNIHLIGVGVGPFSKENHKVEKDTANLFRLAKFVSVRDRFAFEKCKEWRVNKFIQSPDLCYIMDVSNYVNKRNSLKKIAVVVRDWKHSSADNYYKKIITFVNDYRKKGYDITYISLDMESDVYWNNYLNSKKENYIQWNPEKMTFENFYELVSGFDLMVTARFHGAVFASMMNIPFITIEVEQKLRMIAESFEGGAYCWGNDFNQIKLEKLIHDIEANYADHKLILKEKAANLKKITLEQYTELLKTICENQ